MRLYEIVEAGKKQDNLLLMGDPILFWIEETEISEGKKQRVS